MDNPPASDRNQFSTFKGVFTPSILTILGVIMFLRAGFVVGQAGVLHSLLILILCEAVVLLTAVSLSAIATNMAVKGGGAYYLISRVLGPEFGGSIGLALFAAQALSVPFYVLGFTEVVADSIPALQGQNTLVAMVTTTALFALTWSGASWSIKVQYIVMAILGLGILSALGGAALNFSPERFAENLHAGYTEPRYGFWVMLAIYFPAVTGINAGINMSGDLKNPSRSLVVGTFAAIATGFAIYALQLVLLGGASERGALLERPFGVLLDNALGGSRFLVYGGVIAAALSSAMGSMLGAPRILQALARDPLFRMLRPFAQGSKQGDEPRVALLLTYAIAMGVIALAGLRESHEGFNLIAAIVTMFFLCTYGMTNLAAFAEAFALNPSFRPTFKGFHWLMALAGASLCGGIMALIDPRSAAVAVAVIGLLYYRISRKVVSATYGDARRGVYFASLVRHLHLLSQTPMHAKNWRPIVLVLSGNPESRLPLVRFAGWMEAGRGLVSLAYVIPGTLENMLDRRRAATARLEQFARDNGLRLFPEVLVMPDFDEGVQALVQTHSIGPIKPNLVMMGWPRDAARAEPFARHLRTVCSVGMSAVVVAVWSKRISA